MQQMVVEFTFSPLVWSDGLPVTAADSVYSFSIAADAATPGDKSKLERTAAYEATGEQAVRWTGLPGFLDPTYFINAWPPLPRHQLADITAEELLTAPETVQSPLSSGPFMVDEWQPGVLLRLVRNPHYFRQSEGLPSVGVLTVRFDADLSEPVTAVTSGQCDVVTQDSLGLDDVPTVQAATGITAHFTPSTVFEHVDFGVNSWEYGDDVVGGRPDWFEFVPVRQAIAQCLNRQRMSDELLSGQGPVLDAYIPAGHPLFPEDATFWPYDPQAGNALLDEFGLEDTDADGWREWVERDLQQTIMTTTTFSITLGTDSGSPIRLRLNELVQEDLAACGILVNVYDVPAESWYDDGPFSPLFGRRFDLATFAWRTAVRPPCGLYLSTNVTGPEEQGFGGWNNVNATGWSSADYDTVCQTALAALPGTDEYETNHQEAIRIFTDRLPSVPLFQYVQTAVTAPTVLNFQPDPTQPSELWNVFAWDMEE
jgi:peptide/nickel transport system substrate-binding protein